MYTHFIFILYTYIIKRSVTIWVVEVETNITKEVYIKPNLQRL